MLVDEQFRESVIFILVDRTDPDTGEIKRVPVATAVIVSVPVGEGFSLYACTAKHVVDNSRPFGPMWLRLNKKEGGYDDLKSQQDRWVFHTDPTVDVAAVGLTISLEKFKLRAIPFNMLLSDEEVTAHEIGTGDEAFFAGLFSMHPGHERSQPILRFGNISLMPVEKVLVPTSPESDPVPVDAYLVEARSWGGQSGSPAFVHFALDRKPGLIVLRPGPQFAVLGLVSGHFEIKRDVKLTGDIFGSGSVPVNAGIAIVVPSQKIIDILAREDLVKYRQRTL